MPGKKSKKFIDKKGSVTFHLVHRSQRDPKLVDEEAPEHVLLEEAKTNKKEEQQKFGIYFDDDYDYMQHLKDVNELNEVEADVTRIPAKTAAREEEPRVKLPSSVFGSNYETDVGLLNKAAPLRGPQLDWDPDIVAGLDDDFDFSNPDNLLEDDFIAQANVEEPCSEVNEGEKEKGSDRDEVEEDYPSDEADEWTDDEGEESVSDVGSLGEMSFASEETKTRFTNYSMTSSVMRRNEGLTLLDDRFEKLYEQYDEEEIGALDHEDIGGHLPENSTILNSVLEEFEEKQRTVKLKDVIKKAEDVDVQSESSEDDLITVTEKVPDEKWDCESILSTYSNIYNHPTKISEPKKAKPIRLTKRAGIPAGVLPDKGPTERQLLQEEHAHHENRASTYRSKDETSEERRLRKQAVKSERKARREEKKLNKKAFKSEEIRQKQELMNVKQNLKGIKIV